MQLVVRSYTVSDQDIRAAEVLYPLVQEDIRNELYFPNRQALTCSRRNCALWRHCEREFGGRARILAISGQFLSGLLREQKPESKPRIRVFANFHDSSARRSRNRLCTGHYPKGVSRLGGFL